MREFSNCQLIMITDVKLFIGKLKAEGKEYKDIKDACLKEYSASYWCVPEQRLRDEVIVVALVAYAMDDNQREAVLKIKELTGSVIV